MGTTEVIVVIGFVLFIIFLVRKSSPSSTSYGSLGGVAMSQVLSHWADAFPFFSISSDEFYSSVEKTLTQHDMPNVKIARANNKEGGMFSSSREYLRIKYRDLAFDICAAPFGKDFFVSWWMYETEGLLSQVLKNTKAGDYLQNRAAKRTFYQADQELMFRTCVHNVVLEVIDKLTQQKGLRSITAPKKAIIEGGI